FIDTFGFISSRFNANRLANESGHLLILHALQKHLRQGREAVYTYIFAEDSVMTARDDFDPLAPQREAAFFYGLFLRGHSVEDLRQDIDVPRKMLEKWLRAPDFEMNFRESLQRVYSYRKQVLAIFDGL